MLVVSQSAQWTILQLLLFFAKYKKQHKKNIWSLLEWVMLTL